MNSLDKIASEVAGITVELENLCERLELRDEYRIAFDLWAKAVDDMKGWIRDEKAGFPCMLPGWTKHWRYVELSKRVNLLCSLMEDARERCSLAGDEDWAAEQESIEFDVENREITI
jgi:hypothetical protein